MKKALVVAHPDDEILFFSSILKKVETVIVCFGPSRSTKVTICRRQLQNRYPLKNIEWLNLQEANVFLSANWDHPKLIEDGILVRRNRNAYQKNFITLVELLKTKLVAYDVVYTHNPWGEYGHEEHISVFKAVWSTTELTKTAVYVSSYISDRSKNTFDIQKALLGIDIITEKIPKNFCETIKKLYISTDCWTWDDKYTWPDAEIFIKVENRAIKNNQRLWSSTANPPVMFLTASFKSNYLRRWIAKLFPATMKKYLKRILRKGK